MCSNPQRHRLTTSRCFAATFNKDPLSPQPYRLVCSNVHPFNLQHRPNSTLLHCYNQQQHRRPPPPPRINVARAIRFSSTTRSCNTPTLASPSRYSTSGGRTNLALLHSLTQQLSRTPLFSLEASLLLHPPLSLEQIYAAPPQRPHRRTNERIDHNNAVHYIQQDRSNK